MYLQAYAHLSIYLCTILVSNYNFYCDIITAMFIILLLLSASTYECPKEELQWLTNTLINTYLLPCEEELCAMC